MKFPKWPKEVTIAGVTYQIWTAKKVLDEGGNIVEGLTDDDAKKIWVTEHDDKAYMFSTLFHEMGHVFLRETGLEGNLSHDMEEMIVIGIEKHFLPAAFDIVGKQHVITGKTKTPAKKKASK